MGKDSALGQDPLSWMKVTKENKKPPSVEGMSPVNQNVEKSDQRINSQTTLKQQIPLSTNIGGTRDIPKVPQSPGKVTGGSNNTATSKSRVVIGRLYEKPSPEKAKSAPRDEAVSHEVKHYTEPVVPVSRTVQPVKTVESQINRIPASADRFSSYIIIAYTALMLILGYFVYNDLSKRTSRIEARILAVEKALHVK